jgi:hypothetical protein
MIKFSRGALNRPRHDTPFCNSLCNVCKATAKWVNPVFIRRRRVRDWGYIRSKGSIPSMVSPSASTRLVARQSASRESRTAPEDCSTGHCS